MTTMQKVKLLAWVEPGFGFQEFEGEGESYEQARIQAEQGLKNFIKGARSVEPQAYVKRTECLSDYKPVQVPPTRPQAAPERRRLSRDLTPPLLQRILAPLFR